MEDIPVNLLAPVDEIAALRKQVAGLRGAFLSNNEKNADYYRTIRSLEHEVGMVKEELQEIRLEKEKLWRDFTASERTAYGLMYACDDALNKKEDALKRINALKLEKEQLMASSETVKSRNAELEMELRAARAVRDDTNNTPAVSFD